MRHGRPGGVVLRRPSRGGGSEVGPQEPALEGSRRGDGLIPRPIQEVDSDQFGPPGGVLATGLQDGLHQVRGRLRGIGDAAIIGFDACGTSLLKSTDQALHRRSGQCQCLGDLTGGLALFPKSDQSATNRNGDGTRHGATSWE
jgi:hypothetical protein